MNIGQRVKIKPLDRDTWNMTAAGRLSGKVGTVTETKVTHWNGKERVLIDERVLVTFEPPLAPLYSNGSPVTGFWFDAHEVEELS